VRQKERREIGGRRKRAAHRRERIPLGKPADWRSSDDELRRLEMVFAREEKGVEGGVMGLFIAEGVAWRGG
jgi:hypothetical protein